MNKWKEHKRYFTTLFLLCCLVSILNAQNKAKFQFSGTVSDVVTKETIPYALVVFPELNIWAVTDEQGTFIIKDIVSGEWKIEVSCLGYQKIERKMAVKRNVIGASFKMHAQDLTLKDVVVTAEAGTRLSSSSKIGKAAITHLQAASLSDVLQLLPGQITSNPDLSKASSLTIRETNTSNEENALGTSLVVDGAKISNDANLQSISTVKNDANFPTTGGGGVDARKISPERIESVEVIRGVASAEYGDLTSGAVIMTTKAGASSYEISVKTDPRLKSVAVGKGFRLGGNNGCINFDADYAHAYKDLRSVADSYNRFSAQIGYSNAYKFTNSNLTFNAKLGGYFTKNTNQNDPDKTVSEYVKNKDQEVNLNIFGNLTMPRYWINCVRYNFSASYGSQRTEESREFAGANPVPVTYTKENGEQVGAFLPVDYNQIRIVDGKPVYIQGKLSANSCRKFGNVFNKLSFGAEWSTIGNEGKGKYGEYMPLGFRPRAFSDIPYIHNYAFFVEDKVNIPIGTTSLELQPGIRMTNIITDAVDYDLSWDPRFNAQYRIIDNNQNDWLTQLSIRGGWGIQHKLPTLMHLYPDPYYTDQITYNFLDKNLQNPLVVMTTKVVDDTSNPELKLPESRNMELGIDFKVKSVKGSLCYFNEKLKNAYSFNTNLTMLPYNVYSLLTADENNLPVYENGHLTAGGVEATVKQDTLFCSYNRPGNTGKVDKWGIEYTLNLGKIKSLNTSIILDGAYMNIERTTVGEAYYYKAGSFSNGNRKYAAIYDGEASLNNGNKSERLNTNFRFVTNVPKLRMVISLTAQCVWIDKAQQFSKTGNPNRVVMRDDNGDGTGAIVDGNIYTDSKYYKYVYPVAIINTSGERIPFTEEMLQDPQLKEYALRCNPSFFLIDNPKPYAMLNLRLTKEFSKLARFSFYVNNLTHSNPKRYYRATGMYRRVNTDIYCGAELTFTL